MQAYVIDPAAMTLAATLTTTPLTSVLFSQFSIVSFVANIVAAPFIAAMCVLGVCLFVLHGVPFVGYVLCVFEFALSSALICLVRALSAVPFACVPLYVPAAASLCIGCLAVVALWVLWPTPGKHANITSKSIGLSLLGAFCVFAMVYFLPCSSTQVIALDVGQGDALVVRSEGRTVLLDTGNQPSRLYAALARNGVRSLDAIVVSHADDDHCGCLTSLRGVMPCRNVYVANGTLLSTEEGVLSMVSDAEALVGHANVKELKVGECLSVGAVRLKVVHPQVPVFESSNEESLCLLLETDLDKDGSVEWKGFFSGDAEQEVLDPLIEDGSIPEVNIFKVGHHGSRVSVGPETAAGLNADIALVSVGANNTYGHPNAQVLQTLEESGAQVFRTDERGDVVCSLGLSGIGVKTMR